MNPSLLGIRPIDRRTRSLFLRCITAALIVAPMSCASDGIASSSLLSDSASVNSTRIASIVVSPATASVNVGATVQLTANTLDSRGRTLTGRTVQWSTSNAAIATVSTSGLVTGVAAGTASVTATSGSAGATSRITVVGTSPALSVTTTTLPNGTRTIAYSQTLTATGGSGGNAWSVSSGALPVGLSLAATSGAISGTPTTAGTSSFSVQVRSSDGQTATKPLSITIVQPALSITTASLAGGTQNVAYSQTAAATGGSGSYTWTVATGTLPAGLGIAAATGVISGTPTSAATSSFTLQVASTDGQTATKSLSIVVAAGSGSGSSQTIFFQEAFDDNSLLSRGWYDQYAPFTITTAEHHGGSGSMAAAFAVGGTAPSWVAIRHQFTASNEVYISYWVKYSTNWVGSGKPYHPHEFHFTTTEDSPYANSMTHLSLDIEHNYQSTGGFPVIGWVDGLNIDQTKINQNLVGVTENRAVAGCNGNADGYTPQCFNTGNNVYANGKSIFASHAYFLPSPGPGYKNDWHHVEAYFKLNTISGGVGQLDGVAQYWFDGALAIDLHNVQFRTGAHPTMLFNQLMFTPYIGDGSPVAQTAWYDDLIVANHR